MNRQSDLPCCDIHNISESVVQAQRAHTALRLLLLLPCLFQLTRLLVTNRYAGNGLVDPADHPALLRSLVS